MSTEINNYKICDQIPQHLKLQIKLFYIFEDSDGHNIFFVTFEDMVYAFGSNSFGQLGLGHNTPIHKFTI